MGDTDPLKENCVIMTEDYYYNTDWKCVEERDSGETCPRKQYAYGIRGRNDLVARDNYRYNSSSGSPSCSSAGKERHYALTDAMGSVTAVASTAGAVVERYSYTAFGKGQVMTANFADRSMSLYDWQTRFHGESRDEETGYYNYGYRYYLPELGKWPSRDPIGERGGENLYGFVGNDAISYVDILGLTECSGGRHLNNRKFVLLKTYLGGLTRTGKPAEQIIQLTEDLLNDIQTLGRLQGLANAAAGGIQGLNGGVALVAEAVTLEMTIFALGETNPDLVDYIKGKLGDINKGNGNNAAKGGMITVEYKCLKCICVDRDDWYNPFDWGQGGDKYGWDDPDSQQQSYSVQQDDGLVRFEDRPFVLYKTVSQITGQDIFDAVEDARKSCEK
jgi:RHS repeat-associated protein